MKEIFSWQFESLNGRLFYFAYHKAGPWFSTSYVMVVGFHAQRFDVRGVVDIGSFIYYHYLLFLFILFQVLLLWFRSVIKYDRQLGVNITQYRLWKICYFSELANLIKPQTVYEWSLNGFLQSWHFYLDRKCKMVVSIYIRKVYVKSMCTNWHIFIGNFTTLKKSSVYDMQHVEC